MRSLRRFLLSLSLCMLLFAVQLTLKVGLAFIFVQQVHVAQQRAEIAQQPTKRCEAVLGELGGYAQLLVVDRGLLQLRLGCQLLSAGRRTPSAHRRDHVDV